MTEEELKILLDRFLDRTLPAAEWTHEAHLLVGLMLARRLPQDALLPNLRQTISAYNLATGGHNTEEAGYHETVTAFYAATLGAFARASLQLSAAQAAERLLASSLADRKIVLRAYDEHTLKTKAARLAYRPPDRVDFSAVGLAMECLGDAG
jgi:hypothetical protein